MLQAGHSPWNGGKLGHIGITSLLNSSGAVEIDYKLRTYFTFMFPRHPLDRLVSAFSDKFMGREQTYAKRMAGKIKRL